MEPMKPLKPMQPRKFEDFADMSRWWPEVLGTATSAGSQNDVQYAYFRGARRLLIRQGDRVTSYDTGDHDIQGVSQGGDAGHAKFISNQGPIDLSQLKAL
jgi:hypothetical protein